MATESLYPDALLVQTNLSGAVTDIDDDPDGPDGLWLSASGNNANSVSTVSFPNPTGSPNTGGGLQQFRIWARLTPNATACTFNVYLANSTGRLNGGAAIATGSLASVSGQLIAANWDAALLTAADGSDVRCEFEVIKSGGSPANRTTGEVGAIEWVADYSSSVGATATPGVGASLGSGSAPSVQIGLAATPSIGALGSTGFAPAVSLGLDLTPSPGAIAIAGSAPTVSIGVLANPSNAVETSVGVTPDVGAGLTASPPIGTLSSTGFAPVVTASDGAVSATPQSGVISLIGYAPDVVLTKKAPFMARNMAMVDGVSGVAPMPEVFAKKLTMPDVVSLTIKMGD